MKKKLLIFLIPILMVGLVSGLLLDYYGVISKEVTVNRAITVEGGDCVDGICSETIVIGEGDLRTITSEVYTIISHTGENAPLSIDTIIIPDELGITSVVEYNLKAEGEPVGQEARIFISAEDAGVTDLGSLTSMYWEIYTAFGYPSHIDIILADDIDANEETIDSITAEMAVNRNMAILDIASNLPYEWVKTFELTSGEGIGDVINDSTIFWVTRHGAGTADAPYGKLGDLKAGIPLNSPDINDPTITISSATKVLGFEIEVDNWVADTNTTIRNIHINSNPVEVTLRPLDVLNFDVETTFGLNNSGDYDLTTTVSAR